MTQTTIESSRLIRPVARFVAIGLFLMAFFTTLWALWALYGLPTVVAVVLVAIFAALAVVFVINGVQLIRSASRLPVPSGEESQRRGERFSEHLPEASKRLAAAAGRSCLAAFEDRAAGPPGH